MILNRASLLTAVVLAAAACVPPPEATLPAPVGSATAAQPSCPAQVPSGALVDLHTLDPTIRVDVRYATADNFTGAPLPGYETPRVLLRPEAAASLARVQAALRPQGFGLKVWDGYRPVRATLAMVEWAERTGNEWVLDQGYVARRSGHNRGNTVDLTLIRLETGEKLDMGTPYDTFSEAAHTANARGAVRVNRLRLLNALAVEGWRNYEKEWWHFTHPGEYEPLDIPLGCF